MKISSGLNKQIFLAMAFSGLFPLLVMAFQNHYFARQTIENVEKEHLAFSLHSRELWLRTWVNHTRRDFYHLALDNSDKKNLSDEEIFLQTARKLFIGHLTYRSISLYRPDWSLLIRYPQDFKDEVQSPSKTYRAKLQTPGSLFVVDDDYRNVGKEVILPVGQGLLNPQGKIGAFLVAEINLNRSLGPILADASDLNSGGSYILASEKGKILYQISVTDQKRSPAEQCVSDIVPSQILTSPPREVHKIKNCGTENYFITVPIAEFKWLLISQFETGSTLQQFEKYILYGLVTAVLTFIILVFLSQKLSKRLSAPLDELTRVARQISAGQHNERMPPFKEEYAQEVGLAFNAMMNALEKQQQIIIQSTTLSTIGKMSSSLVHEMRNPLSSIKINLQAIARKLRDDKDYSEMATISLIQVSRLDGMFEDLLQFSKPIEIHMESITFAKLMDEFLTTVKPEAEKKNVDLRVEDKLQDFLFQADKESTCRALINLVGNAIQWSEPGSVVTISGRRPTGNEGVALIKVADSGPGLRPEQMERVFQPFFTTRPLGTGLGLANVKKIMDYQGGSVLAANNPDGGASFSLIFKD
ncbi:MAG: sensor histidine kinase [Proteobacteria bacterium]|jgi:signal transduction histidine kinase|nr:sensor histidine kinase [Desulfocapsa sp.]MBU3944198.1 sensor histidine kinase [Pseudomonadota bacterium]MBU4028799.1 sensor histidine kinase [Pseudomonadota bacterium]MBU4041703.1 sensor histidine kinase [Pseudomonadota bacterium]MBU4083357.1 sensor histidine kinase [Pseudomonadota bacterium]